MAEWKQVSDHEWCLDAGNFRASIWECVKEPGCHVFSIEDKPDCFDSIQATDAESAKREAVSLFRAKLEVALREIKGL